MEANLITQSGIGHVVHNEACDLGESKLLDSRLLALDKCWRKNKRYERCNQKAERNGEYGT
jgi:hypothetical protein